MNIIASLLIAALVVLAVCFVSYAKRHNDSVFFANIAEGTHVGSIPRRADGAYGRYLFVKPGSDANHVALAGVTDAGLGVIDDESTAAEDLLNVQLLGSSKETLLVQPSAAINAGDYVVPAANGQARTLPVAAGTYYIHGRAVNTVTGSYASTGQLVEIDPCVPVQRIVT